MTAANSGKSRPAPCRGSAHGAEYLLRFAFHPIGQPLLIALQVVRDAHNRETKCATITIVRVEVEVVRPVWECVWLDAYHAEMLPLLDVPLVCLTPAANLWWQAFTADLNGQELVFGTERRPTHKAMLRSIV